MPEWVFLGLWGLSTRRAALAWMWGCVAVAGLSLIAAVRYPAALYGAWLLAAVPWYWYSIRWVDQNSSWSRDA